MDNKKVTIKDIAKILGVNQSTVSRALNTSTSHMVTPELVKKVSDKARELGYYPNRMAAALVHNRSFTVGMLVPDLTNPVFPPIIRGLEDVFDKHGYTLIVINSDNKEEYERTAFRKLRERGIDGCIMATAHRQDDVVDECMQQKIPLVLVNRMTDRHDVNCVINDDEVGIRLTVDHLLELGHEKIAHISGPQNTTTGHARLKKFKACMKEHKLEHSHVVIGKSFSVKSGYEAMKKLLKQKEDITAVVTANDLLALGCLDAMKEAGLKCPEDISITGYNNIPFMGRIMPALTTVAIEHYQIGLRAAETLLAQLKSKDRETIVIKLMPKLIVRDSTAAPFLKK